MEGICNVLFLTLDEIEVGFFYSLQRVNDLLVSYVSIVFPPTLYIRTHVLTP